MDREDGEIEEGELPEVRPSPASNGARARQGAGPRDRFPESIEANALAKARRAHNPPRINNTSTNSTPVVRHHQAPAARA